MKISKKSLIAAIIAISALVGAAYAATVLLSQNFPSVTVPPAVIYSVCPPGNGSPGNLFLFNVPTPISGTLFFACPNGTNNPAFTVGTAGTFIPTLTVSGAPATTLPSPYTGLGLVKGGPADLGFTCTFSAATPITFGTGMSLATGVYSYCATYAGVSTSGATLPTFTISWSQ